MKESLFESWVVSEVYKTWWNQGKQARLFYYRDSNQYEIDLLADRNGMLYPFEIKFNPQASHRFKNFHVLKAMDKPVGFAGLIHAANELAPLSEENWLIPARLI
jgi:predicted AAA+ superfamily ATPase